MKNKKVIRLFCAIAVGIFAWLLFNRVEDLKRRAAQQPTVVTVVVPEQPEVPEGYVAPSTNVEDVTEIALARLGFTTSNSVGISVK